VECKGVGLIRQQVDEAFRVVACEMVGRCDHGAGVCVVVVSVSVCVTASSIESITMQA
jgi:hypothetical protein